MAYAGDIGSKETWERLKADPAAQLIDVRTAAEWNFVGLPELSSLGRETILLEWQRFPDMAVNPAFAASLDEELRRRGANKDTNLYFLCRSGARSQSAAIALTKAGYRHCWNVAGGFEGARNAEGKRGTVEGWKFEGLPWKQG